jgi:hypothetical protein
LAQVGFLEWRKKKEEEEGTRSIPVYPAATIPNIGDQMMKK